MEMHPVERLRRTLARQLLRWVDGRYASRVEGLAWTGGTVSFRITVGTGATGLGATGSGDSDISERIADMKPSAGVAGSGPDAGSTGSATGS